jgi:FkbM family methyltransferase
MNQGADTIQVETRYGRMWALRADAYITRCLEAYGEYCEAEADLFRSLISPGMAVVEVGANIGAHTIMLARSCTPGPLIAFEPQHRAFQLLCANLVEAGLTTVVALPEALGAEARLVRMPQTDYEADGNFGQVAPGRDEPAATDGWGDGRTVRLATLDSFELSACDFLKIDVEGWETDVLLGARETIARCRPMIYVENDRASHQAELIALLADLGYDQYWHVAPLYSPENFRGAQGDITGQTASLNMFCPPREWEMNVTGLERIDPNNWRSPIAPIVGR